MVAPISVIMSALRQKKKKEGSRSGSCDSLFIFRTHAVFVRAFPPTLPPSSLSWDICCPELYHVGMLICRGGWESEHSACPIYTVGGSREGGWKWSQPSTLVAKVGEIKITFCIRRRGWYLDLPGRKKKYCVQWNWAEKWDERWKRSQTS